MLVVICCTPVTSVSIATYDVVALMTVRGSTFDDLSLVGLENVQNRRTGVGS